jgi:hypothetical protein
MSIIQTTIGSTASQEIVPANKAVRKLVFHNPNVASKITVFLSPAPTPAAINAGIPLLPGEEWTITGEKAALAWNAIAASGAENGLSVLLYLWPGGQRGAVIGTFADC